MAIETVPTRPRAERAMSLRSALGWLFAAVFLPLLFSGAAFLAYQWNQQRDLAVAQLREQATSLRSAVERELALDQAVMTALAASRDFDKQDWATFHETAKSATEVRPGSWIVVVDREGQNILNTNVPLGTPLPNLRRLLSRRIEVEWQGRKIPLPEWRLFDEPLQTAKPAFSGLVFGPVSKRPVVAINAPVVRGGTARYVLGLAYSSDFFVKLLESQSATDRLLRVIFDRDGLIVARSVGAESFVGRYGAPPFDKGIGNLPAQGSGETISLEGTPVFYAYARSDVNGWVVAVATPRDTVLAPARREQWTWLAVLLTAGLIGAAWAFRFWRRLAIPLAALAEQVRSPGAPAPVGLPPSIEELNLLRQAMHEAANHERVRRQAEQERERAERLFRSVVESSPAGILMVDQRGSITLVNRRVEEYFGYTRDELLGRPVDLLVPQLPRAVHAAHLARYFAAPVARAMGAGRELHGLRKDGTELPIEIGLVPITTGEGQFVLASIVDISARKRAEDELRRSNHDLEQFAYVASHDLQEPLRTVANYTELLAERYRGNLDDKADKYIHYIVEGAKRMQRLVIDVLAFSRAGSQAKPIVPVAASSVVSGVLNMMQPTLADSGARIEVGPLPVVMADEVQLGQVFQNLIGNAIKFRTEAPPHIVIDAQRANGLWLFSVKDNGIGFAPQYAERIFQMFQRLHERGRFDGSGIGLSIVKRIVERHGGRVWAESQAGAGATFRFTLRAAPGPAAEQDVMQ